MIQDDLLKKLLHPRVKALNHEIWKIELLATNIKNSLNLQCLFLKGLAGHCFPHQEVQREKVALVSSLKFDPKVA